MHFGSSRIVLALIATLGIAGAAQADTIFGNHMESAQEVPPNPSPGLGQVICTLNPAMTNLHIHMEASGLTGGIVASHIHGAATYGVNAGVVFSIGVWAGSVDIDWAIPAAQVANLMAGNLYANIHTAMFGGGEIRGQLDMVFTANMDPQQETPPIPAPASMGRGHGLVRWNDAANRIEIDCKDLGGLTGPIMAAHIHQAPVGVAGPVFFNIGPFAGSVRAVWAGVPGAQEIALTGGNLYVNFHTAMFPGGEVRGQLGRATTSVEPGVIASSVALRSFPNPMVGSATVQYSLPGDQPVSLRVIDATGREVRDLASGLGRSGDNEVLWDGRDARGATVPSGVYYYVLSTGSSQQTAKTIVLR